MGQHVMHTLPPSSLMTQEKKPPNEGGKRSQTGGGVWDSHRPLSTTPRVGTKGHICAPLSSSRTPGCTFQSPRQSLWSPWNRWNPWINMWTPWTLYKIHKLYKRVNGVHGFHRQSMDLGKLRDLSIKHKIHIACSFSPWNDSMESPWSPWISE